MQGLKKELIGKSRGGNTTKIHTLVDALGYPVRILLSAGQVSDFKIAPKLIDGLKAGIVMADGGYDSFKFREMIQKQGAIACIPRHRNRKMKFPFDKEQYKERHLVECFFQKLKRFRTIATSFDKLSCRFLAFVHIACILFWLR